jgi:hypothetical protein
MKILNGECMKCFICRGLGAWGLVDGSLMAGRSATSNITMLPKLEQKISGLKAYEQ